VSASWHAGRGIFSGLWLQRGALCVYVCVCVCVFWCESVCLYAAVRVYVRMWVGGCGSGALLVYLHVHAYKCCVMCDVCGVWCDVCGMWCDVEVLCDVM